MRKRSRRNSSPLSMAMTMASLTATSWETVFHRTLLMARDTCSRAEYRRITAEKVAAVRTSVGALMREKHQAGYWLRLPAAPGRMRSGFAGRPNVRSFVCRAHARPTLAGDNPAIAPRRMQQRCRCMGAKSVQDVTRFNCRSARAGQAVPPPVPHQADCTPRRRQMGLLRQPCTTC